MKNWHNKFYGSKTNTILLAVLIVLMIAGIISIYTHPGVCYGSVFQSY